jgi:hypothetical protein
LHDMVWFDPFHIYFQKIQPVTGEQYKKIDILFSVRSRQ